MNLHVLETVNQNQNMHQKITHHNITKLTSCVQLSYLYSQYEALQF